MSTLKNVFAFAGAYIAFVMGSGFASGQEVLQFFTYHGFQGSLGAGIVALSVFAVSSANVMADGKRLSGCDKRSVGIYSFYCGGKLGILFEWTIPIIMFLFLTVMLSGAGAAFNEYYGIPALTGRIIMAVFAYITVALGFRRLVNMIGPLGIGILIFVAAVSLLSVIRNHNGLSVADGYIEKVLDPNSVFTENFWLSGLLYASFNLVTALPFLAGMGRQSNSKKEAAAAGALGGVLYAGGAILLNLALLANLPLVLNKEIPFLWIVWDIRPAIGSVYSIMLLAGIYTTAVPMLWSICDLLKEGGEGAGYLSTAMLIVSMAVFAGHLPFSALVAMLYPSIGVFGIFLLFCILWRKLSIIFAWTGKSKV